MCGICGIINFKDRSPVNAEVLNKMTRVLNHRGPDDGGKFNDGYAGLGIRRLSIIDPEGGTQPIYNEDRNVVIVFNGEIYNFKELREGLKKNGHKFKTSTDTEVIIHLYEERGEECLNFLNGMFAFCIWDKKNEKLFLARDRLGIKPLYYCINEKGLSFASEIKSLLQDPFIQQKLNQEAIIDFFSLGYILSPKSIFKNTYSLPPGYFLLLANGEIKENRYWDLSYEKEETSGPEETSEKFFEVISSSVKSHLISDVPLGAFLSGGIDSSTIVSFMQSSNQNSTKTFSIIIDEHGWNEGDFIGVAKEHFNTEHYESVIDSIDTEIQNLLPKAIWYNDEPFADSSFIPTFLVSSLARTKVKVALSGDGGDENLAGYPSYIADKIAFCMESIPGLSNLTLLQKPVSFLTSNPRILRFIDGLKFPPQKAHYWWRVLFTDEEREKLFSEDFIKGYTGYNSYFTFENYFNKCDGNSFLKKTLYTDIKTWLTDDILRKVDRASMANSLEVRVPFLDHKVVEFCASIPDNLKIRGFNTKYILKKTMSGKVPESIISRKKKGFHLPVSKYIKNQLKDLTLTHLSKNSINSLGILNYNYISSLISEHMAGKRDHGQKIWALLCFSLWHQICYRKKLSEPPETI